MPNTFNLNNLDHNSLYRISLVGEDYNLPFFEIRTPKFISSTEIKDLINSDQDIRSDGTIAVTKVNRNITGITASISDVYQYKRYSGSDGSSSTTVGIGFFAPTASINGDWASYLSGKSGDQPVASFSFDTATTTAAKLYFADPDYPTKLDNAGLFLNVRFTSNNKKAALKDLTFNFLPSASLICDYVGSGKTLRTYIRGVTYDTTGVTNSASTYQSHASTTDLNSSASANTLLKTAATARKTVKKPTTIKLTSDTTEPINPGSTYTITTNFNNSSKIKLKNTDTVKDCLIPIYKLQKSDLSWTSWYICPVTILGVQYIPYVPVIYNDASYGNIPSSFKLDNIQSIGSIPPQTFSYFNGYYFNVASTSSNLYQPIYSGQQTTSGVDLFSNSSPMSSKINIYTGYPASSYCKGIKIAFAVGTYVKNNSGDFIPQKWISGQSGQIYITRQIVIDNFDDVSIRNDGSESVAN